MIYFPKRRRVERLSFIRAILFATYQPAGVSRPLCLTRINTSVGQGGRTLVGKSATATMSTIGPNQTQRELMSVRALSRTDQTYFSSILVDVLEKPATRHC